MSSAARVTLASGLRLSYAERASDGGPAVVMLPGPTDAWRSYGPVLDALPRGIRALAVSQRGHGDSDKPERGYAVEDFAGDVVELLDALELEQAVVVGHSGSCLAARRVALDHPARVAGLVLEASPTTLATSATLREFVDSVVARMADPIDPELARSFVVDTSSDELPPELVEVLVEDVLEVPARVWREMFPRLLEYDDTADLANVGAPTLLIWGDRDPIVSREMQDVLNRRIPVSALTVHPGAGHTPRWDDPRRFARDVVAFVDRVAASA